MFAIATPSLARETTNEAADVEPIRIEYDTAGACPDRASFERQLFARTTRARIADRPDSRTFAVRFAGASGSLTGVLEVRSRTGEVSNREVPGESCEDVVGALALAAALVIDPHASTAPIPEIASAPATPPVSAPAATRGEASVSPVPAPAGWRSTFGVGLAGGVRAGTLPSAAPSAMVFADLALRKGVPSEGAFAPSVRVSFGGTLSQTVPVAASGSSSFGWLGGRADLCPLRARIATSLEARPCAAFEVGALSASTDAVPLGRTPTRPWVAGGAAAFLRWNAAPIFLEAGAQLLAPFARHRFYVGPDSTVFLVPAVGGGGWIGIGVFLFS